MQLSCLPKIIQDIGKKFMMLKILQIAFYQLSSWRHSSTTWYEPILDAGVKEGEAADVQPPPADHGENQDLRH